MCTHSESHGLVVYIIQFCVHSILRKFILYGTCDVLAIDTKNAWDNKYLHPRETELEAVTLQMVDQEEDFLEITENVNV